MLVGADDAHVRFGRTVEHRRKRRFEPAVAGGKAPRRKIVVPAVALRNMERHPVELVRFSVKKRHVLRGGRRVAKAVSDVEAHDMPVDYALPGAPIPGVVIGPHAAPPIEQTKRVRRIECPRPPMAAHRTGCAHADDLLVIVERRLLFRKRRRNDHAFLRLVGEQQVAVKRRIAAKPIEMRPQPPVFTLEREGKRRAFERFLHVALPRRCGKAGFAHREPEHRRNGRFRARCEIQKRRAHKAHIRVVVDGQRHAEAVVIDKVIIPFLDTQRRGLDLRALITLDQAFGMTRLTKMSAVVQQIPLVQFVLHAVLLINFYQIIRPSRPIRKANSVDRSDAFPV